MPAERYAVGIDLGGSKVRGGLLSPDGRLVARLERETEAWKGPGAVLANLKDLITRLLDPTDRSNVAGMGIAAAGQIHPKTHAVVYARNLRWHDVPMTLLNPELLSLGGGVITAVPSLCQTLAERVRDHTTVMAPELRVERPALADAAGIFGAADLVWAAV
jgi:predicted NBD/HSP70 family sugar kinase